MIKSKYLIYLNFPIIFFVQVIALDADNVINDTRNFIDNWVETNQIISKETSEWKIEKGLLETTFELLSSESERLDSELKDLKESASASDEERTTLAAKKESLKAASKIVALSIGSLETSLKEIIPSLPEPLIEKLDLLFEGYPKIQTKQIYRLDKEFKILLVF